MSNDYKVRALPHVSEDPTSMTEFSGVKYAPDAKIYDNLVLEYKYTKTHINIYEMPRYEYVDYYFEAAIDGRSKLIRYTRLSHSITNKLRRAIKSGDIQPGYKIKMRAILSESISKNPLYTDRCDMIMERFISIRSISAE